MTPPPTPPSTPPPATTAKERASLLERSDLTIRIDLVIILDDQFMATSPPIFRTLRVSGGVPLNTFHDKILGPAMGWERNYHGYMFTDLSDGAMWAPLNESSAIDMMHAGMHVPAALDPRQTTLGQVLHTSKDEGGDGGISRMLYTVRLGGDVQPSQQQHPTCTTCARGPLASALPAFAPLVSMIWATSSST